MINKPTRCECLDILPTGEKYADLYGACDYHWERMYTCVPEPQRMSDLDDDDLQEYDTYRDELLGGHDRDLYPPERNEQ